jgi:methylthioribose-1-phosphate isomerase
MTREATGVSDMTTLVIEAELVSDRTTKVELRRLLGEQTAALKELRPLRANLGRAQGAVQSAIQDQNSFRAQNRELQHQLSIAQREARDQKDLAAVASARITDLTHDGNLLLERAMKAERHLQVVLDLANSYMKHTT